jgi:cytochrome oxidase Cu insertion factor (SCO1/SenC/PrrC family)/thiol-disulfide isomerase/thioredoxin
MRLRALGIGTVAALAALGLFATFIGIKGPGSGGGVVLVFLSSRSGDQLGDTQVWIHSPRSGWSVLAYVANVRVPAAPKAYKAVQADVAPGDYDGLRLAGRDLAATIRVRAGQVEPVLVGIAGGVPQDLFAGNQDYNNGLLGLQGRLKQLPDFALLDQDGRTQTRASVAGAVVVLAAFHTTCHDTCPLYTSILYQLHQRLPASVQLLEVSTDPAVDSVAALHDYQSLAGTSWPLLTGSADQLAAFWAPFGVRLSGADSHTNFLGVFDAHGYLRHFEDGIPDAGSVPGGLSALLSREGIKELHGHGDGWDAAAVADQVRAASNLGSPSAAGGGLAPVFQVNALGGGKVGTADFSGKPLVLNFWATSCAPCRKELPLLQKEAARQQVALLLVDERDSESAARAFLGQVDVNAPVASDPDGSVGRLYGVAVLPVTVFIRADGTIEGKYLGQTDAAVLGDHLAALTR